MSSDLDRVTPESRVTDICTRYPGTGPIFLQYGRMFQARKGDLYATYGTLTVTEYARENGVDLPALLRELAAAAETHEFLKHDGWGSSDRTGPVDADPTTEVVETEYTALLAQPTSGPE